MQALNSLATPEEKLAALCKKYADSVRPLPPLGLIRSSGGWRVQVKDAVLRVFSWRRAAPCRSS